MEHQKDGRTLFEVAEVGRLLYGAIGSPPGRWQFFVEIGTACGTESIKDGRGQVYRAPMAKVIVTRLGLELIPPGQEPTGILISVAQPSDGGHDRGSRPATVRPPFPNPDPPPPHPKPRRLGRGRH